MQRFVTLACLLASGLAAGGCFDTGSSSAGTSSPTLVGVDPADFLGNLPCVDAEGAPRSYVVTLHGETPPGDASAPAEFDHPSSPPTSCNRIVTFGFVTPGNFYTADVDVYETDSLTPLGSGSRIMLDSKGNRVEKSWSTQCGVAHDGNGARPAISVSYRTVYVKPCDALTDLRTSKPSTGVDVDLVALQGDKTCSDGEAPGAEDATISGFQVKLLPQGDVRAASCGGDIAPFTDLTPGTRYDLGVLALGSDGTSVAYSTTCSATAVENVVIKAACGPLSPGGSGFGGAGGAGGSGGTGGSTGGTGGMSATGGSGGSAGAAGMSAGGTGGSGGSTGGTGGSTGGSGGIGGSTGGTGGSAGMSAGGTSGAAGSAN